MATVEVPVYRFTSLSLSLSDLPETLCRSASRCVRAPRSCDGDFWGPMELQHFYQRMLGGGRVLGMQFAYGMICSL